MKFNLIQASTCIKKFNFAINNINYLIILPHTCICNDKLHVCNIDVVAALICVLSNLHAYIHNLHVLALLLCYR